MFPSEFSEHILVELALMGFKTNFENNTGFSFQIDFDPDTFFNHIRKFIDVTIPIIQLIKDQKVSVPIINNVEDEKIILKAFQLVTQVKIVCKNTLASMNNYPHNYIEYMLDALDNFILPHDFTLLSSFQLISKGIVDIYSQRPHFLKETESWFFPLTDQIHKAVVNIYKHLCFVEKYFQSIPLIQADLLDSAFSLLKGFNL